MDKNVVSDTHRDSMSRNLSQETIPPEDRMAGGAREPGPAAGREVPPAEGGPPSTRMHVSTGKEASLKRRGGERTRGGSSYQHSLSARGIKSSGQARSHSNEDLMSTMERLERATPLPPPTEDARAGRRAYGHGAGRGPGRGENPGERPERHPRGPLFDW